MAQRRILALGGGGFSTDAGPLVDDFLLSLAPAGRRPRVCFVPTASGDADTYIARFLDAFPPARAEASVLKLFERTVTDLAAFVAGQDVVYVGGGSTVNLLAVWRAHGLDHALADAYDNGVVLAGLSAGMNCWFEASVTDSYHVDELAALSDGLGFIAGSACPHYDGEPLRRPTYTRLVAEGFPEGHAAQDSCALLFEDGVLADAVTSAPGAGAFFVSATGERPISARYLG